MDLKSQYYMYHNWKGLSIEFCLAVPVNWSKLDPFCSWVPAVEKDTTSSLMEAELSLAGCRENKSEKLKCIHWKKPCLHASGIWKEKHYVDILKMHLWEDKIKRQTTICGLVGSYERFKPLKKNCYASWCCKK